MARHAKIIINNLVSGRVYQKSSVIHVYHYVQKMNHLANQITHGRWPTLFGTVTVGHQRWPDVGERAGRMIMLTFDSFDTNAIGIYIYSACSLMS